MPGSSDAVPQIGSGTVSLVVTSPPFLNVVDYATDNWLRCWFIGVDAQSIKITVPRQLVEWQEVMTRVFMDAFTPLPASQLPAAKDESS